MNEATETKGFATSGGEGLALSDRVAEELHRRIISGEIPLGSTLRQNAVAEEFQISRTPVREAFRALHGQGIVEILPNRGALVRGPTPRDVRENHEVRAEVEGLAGELASERIDDAQLARLHEAVARFDAVVEATASSETTDALAEEWRAANALFHSVITEAADNAHLIATIQYLRRRIPHNTTFPVLSRTHRMLRESADDHRTILAAIESGDGRKARRLLRAQVLLGGKLVARRYELDKEQNSRKGSQP